jgi:hypothetical protein
MEPFTDGYLESELKKVKYNRIRHGNLRIMFQNVAELVECYMYLEKKRMCIPVLTENGKVWMSITPLEVESHYMPIQFAEGRVGVGGLGMGYYIQRILDKDQVKQVVVYEKNEKIIELYVLMFGADPKLKIVCEDVRQLKGEQFDFFYNDIYPFGMMEEMIIDMKELTANNYIKQYHFWTIEQMIFEMIKAGLEKKIPIKLRNQYLPFINKMINSKDLLQNMGLGKKIYDAFKSNKLFP